MSVASSKNYMHKDGAEWVIGDDGTMQVKSGGEINVESGGLLDVEAGATLKVSGRIDRAASVELFDDFLGDVLEDAWSGAKGTDAQAVVPTIVAGAEDGWVRLTAGDTVTVAESLSSLTHGLNWKAESGNLVFEARVKPVSSVAAVAYFVGFTDVLATTTLEEPATVSGTTFTTNAADAVGFLFDTDATTDNWKIVGVANDVDATHADSGVAPVAGTAQTLKVVLTTAGVASFYINGTLIGTLEDAVTASVALTPIVSVMTRTTAVKSIDVDYIHVAKSRDA